MAELSDWGTAGYRRDQRRRTFTRLALGAGAVVGGAILVRQFGLQAANALARSAENALSRGGWAHPYAHQLGLMVEQESGRVVLPRSELAHIGNWARSSGRNGWYLNEHRLSAGLEHLSPTFGGGGFSNSEIETLRPYLSTYTDESHFTRGFTNGTQWESLRGRIAAGSGSEEERITRALQSAHSNYTLPDAGAFVTWISQRGLRDIQRPGWFERLTGWERARVRDVGARLGRETEADWTIGGFAPQDAMLDPAIFRGKSGTVSDLRLLHHLGDRAWRKITTSFEIPTIPFLSGFKPLQAFQSGMERAGRPPLAQLNIGEYHPALAGRGDGRLQRGVVVAGHTAWQIDARGELQPIMDASGERELTVRLTPTNSTLARDYARFMGRGGEERGAGSFSESGGPLAWWRRLTRGLDPAWRGNLVRGIWSEGDPLALLTNAEERASALGDALKKDVALERGGLAEQINAALGNAIPGAELWTQDGVQTALDAYLTDYDKSHSLILSSRLRRTLGNIVGNRTLYSQEATRIAIAEEAALRALGGPADGDRAARLMGAFTGDAAYTAGTGTGILTAAAADTTRTRSLLASALHEAIALPPDLQILAARESALTRSTMESGAWARSYGPSQRDYPASSYGTQSTIAIPTAPDFADPLFDSSLSLGARVRHGLAYLTERIGNQTSTRLSDPRSISTSTIARSSLWGTANHLNQQLARFGLDLPESMASSAGAYWGNLALYRALPAVAIPFALGYLDYTYRRMRYGRQAVEDGRAPGLLSTARANLALGGTWVADHLGLTNLAKSAVDYIPGLDNYITPRSHAEYKDYLRSGYDPIRAGAHGPLDHLLRVNFNSRTPVYGGKITRWEPNYYARDAADPDFSASTMTRDQYYAHSWIPTPEHPFSPINRLRNPYWNEAQHETDRPTPYTGPLVQPSGGPFEVIGRAINLTVGSLIKPTRIRARVREELAEQHEQQRAHAFPWAGVAPPQAQLGPLGFSLHGSLRNQFDQAVGLGRGAWGFMRNIHRIGSIERDSWSAVEQAYTVALRHTPELAGVAVRRSWVATILGPYVDTDVALGRSDIGSVLLPKSWSLTHVQVAHADASLNAVFGHEGPIQRSATIALHEFGHASQPGFHAAVAAEESARTDLMRDTSRGYISLAEADLRYRQLPAEVFADQHALNLRGQVAAAERTAIQHATLSEELRLITENPMVALMAASQVIGAVGTVVAGYHAIRGATRFARRIQERRRASQQPLSFGSAARDTDSAASGATQSIDTRAPWIAEHLQSVWHELRSKDTRLNDTSLVFTRKHDTFGPAYVPSGGHLWWKSGAQVRLPENWGPSLGMLQQNILPEDWQHLTGSQRPHFAAMITAALAHEAGHAVDYPTWTNADRWREGGDRAKLIAIKDPDERRRAYRRIISERTADNYAHAFMVGHPAYQGERDSDYVGMDGAYTPQEQMGLLPDMRGTALRTTSTGRSSVVNVRARVRDELAQRHEILGHEAVRRSGPFTTPREITERAISYDMPVSPNGFRQRSREFIDEYHGLAGVHGLGTQILRDQLGIPEGGDPFVGEAFNHRDTLRGTATVNPIRNQMPDWLPEDDRNDWHNGDPYSKIPGGHYRLPGAGYEKLHRVRTGVRQAMSTMLGLGVDALAALLTGQDDGSFRRGEVDDLADRRKQIAEQFDQQQTKKQWALDIKLPIGKQGAWVHALGPDTPSGLDIKGPGGFWIHLTGYKNPRRAYMDLEGVGRRVMRGIRAKLGIFDPDDYLPDWDLPLSIVGDIKNRIIEHTPILNHFRLRRRPSVSPVWRGSTRSNVDLYDPEYDVAGKADLMVEEVDRKGWWLFKHAHRSLTPVLIRGTVGGDEAYAEEARAQTTSDEDRTRNEAEARFAAHVTKSPYAYISYPTGGRQQRLEKVMADEQRTQAELADVVAARAEANRQMADPSIPRSHWYSLLDRFRILADVQPNSEAYRVLASQLSERLTPGTATWDEYQAIKERARQQGKTPVYPYRFSRDNEVQSHTVTVDHLIDPNTFVSVEDPDHPIRFAGIRVTKGLTDTGSHRTGHLAAAWQEAQRQAVGLIGAPLAAASGLLHGHPFTAARRLLGALAFPLTAPLAILRAGIKGQASVNDGDGWRNALAQAGIRPGAQLSVLGNKEFGRDATNSEDDDSGVPTDQLHTERAIVYAGGRNVNRWLLNHGYAKERRSRFSPAETHLFYSRAQRSFGRAMEAITHFEIPWVSTRFWRVRSAVEEFERSQVYGKDHAEMRHPFRDFIIPGLTSAWHRNPLVAGTSIGLAASLLWHEPGTSRFLGSGIARGIALAGFAVGAIGALLSQRNGPQAPKWRKKQWALHGYFDRLNYLRQMRGYTHERKLARDEEGTDVDALYDGLREDGRQRKERIAELSEERRQLLIRGERDRKGHISGGDAARVEDLQREIAALKDHETLRELPEHAARAIGFRQRAERTLYGLPKDATVADRLAALPRQHRQLIQRALHESAPDERRRMARLLPEDEQRAIGHWLDPNMPETPREELSDYFRSHFLPKDDWKGWDPEQSLEPAMVKEVSRMGIDPYDMGPMTHDQMNAGRRHPLAITRSDQTRTPDPVSVREELYRVLGDHLENLDVSVRARRAHRHGANISAQLVHDRDHDLREYLNYG